MGTKKELHNSGFLVQRKKIIAFISLIILAASFIPFERVPENGLRESVVSFAAGVNYKEEEYHGTDSDRYSECLWDAKYSSYGKDNEDKVYEELKNKCYKGLVDTKKAINKLILNDGVKITVGGEYGRKVLFIGEDGKLYGHYDIRTKSKGEYTIDYSEPVELEVISGSAITITARFTVTCRGFGLICDNEHTNLHETLVIGRDATVEKYSKTCDYFNPEFSLDGSGECVYKNDTPIKTKIVTLLNRE